MANLLSANTTNQKLDRRHHKLMIALATIFCLIIIFPIVLLGWLGFVPGLSGMMGSSKPKDLGVHYTPDDYTSYEQKTSFTLKEYSLAPVSPNNPNQNNF